MTFFNYHLFYFGLIGPVVRQKPRLSLLLSSDNLRCSVSITRPPVSVRGQVFALKIRVFRLLHCRSSRLVPSILVALLVGQRTSCLATEYVTRF
jgi:hypothetical protein